MGGMSTRAGHSQLKNALTPKEITIFRDSRKSIEIIERGIRRLNSKTNGLLTYGLPYVITAF